VDVPSGMHELLCSLRMIFASPLSPQYTKRAVGGMKPSCNAGKTNWSGSGHLYGINSMSRLKLHAERHAFERTGWLRAAVLGANDGIVSTASLILGVAAAEASRGSALTAGIAALVGGAMSMAAGEYVSVSSQSDTEKADTEREKGELRDDPGGELEELTGIYAARGLEVATQLMAKDPLKAHLRDELGISDTQAAKPVQAAFTSAATFAVGAALPLLIAALVPLSSLVLAVSASTLVFLALLGAAGARTGGARMGAAVFRVVFWGALAMGVTALIGKLTGAVI
jgi:vacuolar iron transporter family protein